MDSIRVSEAPDTGSIPVEATDFLRYLQVDLELGGVAAHMNLIPPIIWKDNLVWSLDYFKVQDSNFLFVITYLDKGSVNTLREKTL